MRLIDADELLKDVENYSPFGAGLADIYDAQWLVGAQPTVDAVEVVHGHWEWHGGDDDCMVYGFCSNCHNSYEEDLAMVYKYCPHCGAKMDGDGNG